MEKEYQISWLKIIGITALIVGVIVLICLLYPKKDNTLLTQQTYISNITLMKDAGFEYFSGSHLPKEIGDSERLSLDEMLARNLIVEFLDEEGNSCHTQNSYIEATKTMDNEYEMSVYLSCDNKSDYIVTSISNEVTCTDCNTTNQESSKEEINEEEIPSSSINNNNSNNSTNSSNSNSSSSGNSRPVEITQNTNVNINYVDSCCTNGNNGNCNDNCLTNVYHSVAFDSNGGSVIHTQIIKHGGYATYVEPYRYGYEFLGWYLNGVKYDFNTPVTEQIVLVAKWEKKEEQKPSETFIVNFESNGGTSVDFQRVEKKDLVKRPNNPTRECYRFLGWYIDSALTEKYDFNTPVTSDMTLYAKWQDDGSCTVRTYRVKFDSNKGSSVATQWVEEGDRAYQPKDPKRDGYEFVGWYLNGKKFNFNTRIYEDITLEAKWEDVQEKYNKYCKIEEDTYYSISYVSANQNTWNYSWQVRFYNLNHVQNLKVIDAGYLTTTNMYNRAYQESYDKGIVMVGATGKYNVAVTSGTMLKEYSLKSNNFGFSVNIPYYQNGYWYTDLSVNIRNYSNLSPYYASNLGSSIYFVPFYFTTQYTNLDKCTTDKASNRYKYDNYEIVDTFWR